MNNQMYQSDVEQYNLLITAKNCLYYSEFNGFIDSVKYLNVINYNIIRKECIRLGRFVEYMPAIN